jgi:hypothetical protein
MLPVPVRFLLSVVSVSLLLQGCSSDDDGELLRGVFLDSPVSGLKYESASVEGFTEPDGSYYYAEGETIVFSIGELSFPPVPGAPTITPLEIAQVDDVEDEKTVNLLRLLQSIDFDQDPDNGIEIPIAAHDFVKIPQLAFDGSISVVDFIDDVIDQTYSGDRPLVDSEAAVEHFVNTLSRDAAEESMVIDTAALSYLVEKDETFEGAFLSVQSAQYALNVQGDWESGLAELNHNVLRLKSAGGTNRFVTSGTQQNQLVYCIANRPTAIDECGDNARLFAVFDNEVAAADYIWPVIDEMPEPGIGAAVDLEENTDDSGVDSEAATQDTTTGNETGDTPADNTDIQVDNTPDLESGVVVPGQSAGQSSGQTAGSVPEVNVDSGDVQIDSSTDQQSSEQSTDNDSQGNTTTDRGTVDTGTVASGSTVPEVPVTDASQVPETDTSPQPPTSGDTVQPPAEQAARAVVASTNCPETAKAPVQLSVVASAPAGCQWTPFESSPWSWNSSYDSEANIVNASEAGTYQGSFEHTCIEASTGETVTVTASCSVDVKPALGPEDITDLFFITGQSNAAGLQTAFDASVDVPDNRVFAFTDNGWQVAALQQNWELSIPGNFSAQDSSRSPYNHVGFQLSKSIAEKSNRVVGLVVLTAPGEGISHWDFNSEFFVEIREKATAALNELPHKSQFDAMLWMQGETDWLFEGTADPGATGFADQSSEAFKNYYPTKLFQLISNLRGESWFRFDGRFVCTETKKAALNPHLMALNWDDDPYSGCAAASDLPTRSSDPFGNHFSAGSLRTLGQRIADVYLAMEN